MDNFNFKKSLGQNFLIDNNIREKIVSSASIEDNSLIIEVGPGNGSITKLLDKIKNDNLTVIYGDFLSVDLKEVLSKYKGKKLHLIANLPYYITTPIITKVINETDVSEMIIMVQKEVGDRFKSMPGSKDYNSLSVYLQYYFDIEKVCLVSKSCFVPKPNVDSIVVKFTRKKELLELKDKELFFKFVRDAFKQKRKNLRNNLKEYDLEKVEESLNKIGKDLTYRAEQLSLEDFVSVFNEIC